VAARARPELVSGGPHGSGTVADDARSCRANAAVTTCPASTLDGYTDASTQAAIGKASLILEEQQNWAEE
jgi:hypothetical protein